VAVSEEIQKLEFSKEQSLDLKSSEQRPFFIDESRSEDELAGKIIKKIKVLNRAGLHTRPATTIVKTLQRFQADVTFSCKKINANAKSILGLLALAATRGTTITVTCEGKDAEFAMQALVEGFETKFGEDDHG